MTPPLRRFVPLLLLIVCAGALLRTVWLRADPPWYPTVGVIWHDEGAWVHNARNEALFGAWRQDAWNPMYVAPVFTAAEYASFEVFGVGTWQARLVSALAGTLSVALLALGVRRIAGSAAGLIAAALLATNYVYVMYDRAAIMEGLMVAFIVAAWWASTRSEDHPAWGLAAGILAALAYFTKAAAAFYVAALGAAAVFSLLRRRSDGPESADERRAAIWTIAGLALAFGAALAFFVLPHWSDYRFYNWQISVTRKPSYDLKSILTRVSWFPVLHDQFSRMWFAVVVGLGGAWSIVIGWKRALLSERLLLLWLTIGILELLVHDVGNERRFVFLIPVLIALTAIVLSRSGGLLPEDVRLVPSKTVWLLSPVILYSAYIVCGPVARLAFIYEVKPEARLAGVLALALSLAVLLFWNRVAVWLSAGRWSGRFAAALTVALVGANLVEFTQYAVGRTYKNYYASVELGRVLPPGTEVQGKLANGLSLENRIRPIFIGHGFGNFSDRKSRGDVRYILTYTAPAIGYEGSQIEDVLAAYPGWRAIMSFDVAETPSGHDRAALIDKRAGH
jgi:4-amino-4-deoxy-L-arabinose transferase-like glycosyltransferase